MIVGAWLCSWPILADLPAVVGLKILKGQGQIKAYYVLSA